jgi:hypothetical protein
MMDYNIPILRPNMSIRSSMELDGLWHYECSRNEYGRGWLDLTPRYPTERGDSNGYQHTKFAKFSVYIVGVRCVPADGHDAHVKLYAVVSDSHASAEEAAVDDVDSEVDISTGVFSLSLSDVLVLGATLRIPIDTGSGVELADISTVPLDVIEGVHDFGFIGISPGCEGFARGRSDHLHSA